MKVAFILLLLVVTAVADIYLHNPRGSNDRNRERRENRRQANRLFDSQNNAKGGYPWAGDPQLRGMPDELTYYVGSTLRIEYTNQHSCGINANVRQTVTRCTVACSMFDASLQAVCDIIIQYACDTIDDNLVNARRTPERDLPGLRDGYPNGDKLIDADSRNTEYKMRAVSNSTPPGGDGAQRQDLTARISTNVFKDNATARDEYYTIGWHNGVEFGYHESIEHYTRCASTSRNKGLYTADQRLNLQDARATRQNPNGARQGLECPEERDYHPYWNQALNPWHDIVILTNNKKKCDYFQANSPNVVGYGYCDLPENAKGPIPITESGCVEKLGNWVNPRPNGPSRPDCQLAMYSRDNHLGNAVRMDSAGRPRADGDEPSAAYYDWKVPAFARNKRCVLRLRYNISTTDYPADTYAQDSGREGVGITSALNCPRVRTITTDDPDYLEQNISNPQCTNLLLSQSRPLINRPYVNLFPAPLADASHRLSIALNTNQAGRTFQDRSYVFSVKDPPAEARGKTIWNLNVRGRRGNIVQCYPAVEYDFVPNKLDVNTGDYLHVQLHGSDFNPARNPNNGEGWRYSDRSNIVQMDDSSSNFPTHHDAITLFPDVETAFKWALLGQTGCKVYNNGDRGEQNNRDNCGKLNSAPNRFPPNTSDGLMRVGMATGTYWFMSTRNNNFSNRGQKGRIRVNGGTQRGNGFPTSPGYKPSEDAASGHSAGTKTGIAFGVMLGVAVLGAGVLVWGKRHPASAAGGLYESCTEKFGLQDEPREESEPGTNTEFIRRT